MGRAWSIRIPAFAWAELVQSNELIDFVHRRIAEIAKAKGYAKVRIGRKGRHVWLAKAEVVRAQKQFGEEAMP